VKPKLHERLSCRPTNDIAVALLGDGRAEAAVIDHFPTARNEAVTHASLLSRRGLHPDPPATYHELWSNGRYVWVHPDRSLGQLAVARLFRHEALNYEQEPFRLVSVVSPKKAVPILLIAVGEGARGERHISLLREEGPGLKFRPYSLLDLRGLVTGGWRVGMKGFGSPIAHPILKPFVDVGSAGGASESVAA
jgi:hypothetical protein